MNLKNFIRGWVVGNFEPSLFKTNQFELAIKKYKAGDFEEKHHHKIATEYTMIISGTVEMNGIVYGPDDIATVSANESSDFKCLTDTVLVCLKFPGAENDKYIDT